MKHNFNHHPGWDPRWGGRPPRRSSFFALLEMLIEFAVDTIAFIIKTIIAVISGRKIGDVLKGQGKSEAEQNTPSASNDPKKEKKKKKINKAQTAALIIGILFLIAGGFNLFGKLFDPLEAMELAWGSDVLMPLVISGISMLFWGSIKHFEERRDLYLILIGESEHFDLSALAAAADVSLSRVKRDIKKMISRGDFGDRAYLDRRLNILFRTPEAGERYRILHSDPEVRTADTQGENKRGHSKAGPVEDEKQVQDRVEKDEYRIIILEIRRLNDEIADIAVSEKIYRIEEHTQNIFDYVKAHPEKRDSIRTFMNYYLPTTLKLLTSYAKIEKLGATGENMKRSKEDIEKTLDMLVYAFEREVDQLFESESIDISSDIDVLETMLRRDGMTRGYTDDLFGGGAAAQQKPESDEE